MTIESTQGARSVLDSFKNHEAIAGYADGPPRFVPGFDALHRMTAILLAENAPAAARVLVLGAGGGLELNALALAHPGWSFVGVDPAEPMLDMARRTLGPLMERVELVHGYIDDAPPGPFDAATCLLTLHFLDAPERLRTAQAIRARMKPGAPFVAAHSSFPQDPSSRTDWLARYAAYAVASGADPQQAARGRDAVDAHLNLLDPHEDERILRDAGFSDIAMFYAAFTWRGWIARA
nr:class I SAM-dependent methyltransferase [Bosea sp. 124]